MYFLSAKIMDITRIRTTYRDFISGARKKEKKLGVEHNHKIIWKRSIGVIWAMRDALLTFPYKFSNESTY